MTPTGQKKGSQYTAVQKVEAMVRLALNGYDWQKTAEETGIAGRTIRRWMKEQGNQDDQTVHFLMERAVKQILRQIPENIPAKEWALTIAILTDKLLLLEGKATSRREVLTRGLDLTPEELEDVLTEADNILAEAAASRASVEGLGEGEE